MNLYKFHQCPEALDNFVDIDFIVPEVFFSKYRDNPAELAKREKAIANHAECAYHYAMFVLMSRFPLGEPAIAKNPRLSLWYAQDVMMGAFPLGEAAIKRNSLIHTAYKLHLKYKNEPIRIS